MVDERVAAFVAAVQDDPRVRGAARMRNVAGLPAYAYALVVTTWDGLESLPAEMPQMLRSAFGATAVCARSTRPEFCSALGADGVRLDVELRRAGDLKPSPDGAGAEILLDSHGLVEQWIRYCVAEHGEEAAGCGVPNHDDLVLRADLDLRLYESERVLLLPEDASRLRHARQALRAADPVEAAVAARIDTLIRTLPRRGAAERLIGGAEIGRAHV